MLSNVTGFCLFMSSVLVLGCGGSEFQTNDTADASAGSGGSSGSAGTGGTAGTGGSSGSAGTGGASTGGTGGAETGGTGGAATGGTGGAAGGPPCDSQCVPLPPPDWNGPAALLAAPTDDVPAPCEGYYDQTVAMGSDNTTWEPAHCDCTCSSDNSKAILEAFGGPNCTNSPCGKIDLPNGVCTAPPSSCTGVVGKIRVSPPPDVCAATVEGQVDEVHIGGMATLCNNEEKPPLADCSVNEFCVVDGAGEICIWKPGETGCPPGPFSHRHIIAQGFTDDRGCTDCACGTVGNVGTFKAFAGDSCATSLAEFTVPTTCLNSPTTANGLSFMYTADESVDICKPTMPSAPMGSVTLDDPITVCCL